MASPFARTVSAFRLVILAALCWSTAGVFINGTMQGGGVTPLSLAFWRVAVTFACLLIALLFFRRDLLRVARRDLPWLAGMGALAMGTFQVLWILSGAHKRALRRDGDPVQRPRHRHAAGLVFWREALTWRKWLPSPWPALALSWFPG